MAKVSKTESLKIEGKVWVKLFIEICSTKLEPVFMVIERNGEAEPFLARHGWQASEDSNARLPLKIERLTDTSLIVYLEPPIIQNLDNANYIFHLLEENLTPIEKVVHFWRRAPLNPMPKTHADKPVTDGGPTVDSNLGNTGSPWAETDPSLSTGPWASPEGATSEIESEITPKEPSKEKQPSEPISDEEVKVVICKNPKCGAKIFRKYSECPFCQFSRN